MNVLNTRLAVTVCISIACGRQTSSPQGRGSTATVPSTPPRISAPLPPRLVEPTRLAELGVSAYQVSLALDGDVVYLLTSNAAYRLLPGQPTQGIQLDLGIGPVLTQSAFVFWSKGHIWRAPKVGGETRSLTPFPHQPQYFVASGDRFAWIDLSEDGRYTIQTLEGKRPIVLVASMQELSALAMIRDTVYFVERPTDRSWRIGKVRTDGGAVEIGPEHQGRRPSALAASESVFYYDVDKTEIRKLVRGVAQEETLLSKFVCSPMHVSNHIYCGCVEGMFAVSSWTHEPRVLATSRVGPIASVTSNATMVVWVVDAGSDRLAVEMLPVTDIDAQLAR